MVGSDRIKVCSDENFKIWLKLEHLIKKSLFTGPKIKPKMTFAPEEAKKMKHEYGDLSCTIEIVR